MLATERRRDLLALLLFGTLAAWLLRDGLSPGKILISSEALRNSAPWSASLPRGEPHNRFLVDQSRIYYPYLLEAARIYRGEVDALWTSRGGGGLPFLGNLSSALLHPLTLLAAGLPIRTVPLVGAFWTLVLSAQFTWLFLRRLQLSAPAAAAGALGFGFGGHQIFWLQYALSHTLLALPLAFWATERVVEDRSRRRLALLVASWVLLLLGGHPETAYVAGLVAGLWALYRLWDSHGRFLLLGAVLLAAALSAVQWLPFLEYAWASHGRWLRQIQEAGATRGVSWGASFVYLGFLLLAAAMLRSVTSRGILKKLAAVLACTVAVVLARRLGMTVSAGALVLPEMYGNPVGGGVYSGAEDFPGLNAGYVGALSPLLLGLGFFVGLGRGFTRFFGVTALLLWGAAFAMPGVEGLVRLAPGLGQVAPTRLLGPAGFAISCGAAMVADRLAAETKPGVLVGMARVALSLSLALLASALVLRLPSEPHGGRTIVSKLESPRNFRRHHRGDELVPVRFRLEQPADAVRVRVGNVMVWDGPMAATGAAGRRTVLVGTHRLPEGRHTLRVEVERKGVVEVLADQPLIVRRDRSLSARDLTMLGAALGCLAWLMRGRPRAPWVVAVLVAADVLSLGEGYNAASPAGELFPPTRTGDFLRRQPPPFRIFTEGTILPPDTQFAAGVDHLLSYDNLGFHTTYRLLVHVPVDMDAFPRFAFSRDAVGYGSPRFDALDVRYVLTGRDQDLSDLPGMRLVHESETRVWENGGSLGRAWVVGQAVDGLALPAAELALVDLARTAVLEQSPPVALGGSGSASVRAHRGAEITVVAEADGPALLVLAENHAPGWSASVDGGPWEPTLRADVSWQAVPIPAGKHAVVFRYSPASYRWGATLSLAAAAVWLLLLLTPRKTPQGA